MIQSMCEISYRNVGVKLSVINETRSRRAKCIEIVVTAKGVFDDSNRQKKKLKVTEKMHSKYRFIGITKLPSRRPATRTTTTGKWGISNRTKMLFKRLRKRSVRGHCMRHGSSSPTDMGSKSRSTENKRAEKSRRGRQVYSRMAADTHTSAHHYYPTDLQWEKSQHDERDFYSTRTTSPNIAVHIQARRDVVVLRHACVCVCVHTWAVQCKIVLKFPFLCLIVPIQMRTRPFKAQTANTNTRPFVHNDFQAHTHRWVKGSERRASERKRERARAMESTYAYKAPNTS